MAQAAAAIQKKATAFVASMNAAVKAKRDKKLAELKKAGEAAPDSKLVKIDFVVSKAGVTLSRTPDQQAESVASGRSWTCASAHMVDKARHVPMFYTLPGKKRAYSKTAKEPWGTGEAHFMTYSEFCTEWAKQLVSHGVRNYAGGKVFSAKDAWHIELPSGKLLHADPAVTKCLIRYAELTRLEGCKPNKKFESSKSWKSDLASHLKAAEAEKARRDLAARVAELKTLQFDGSAAGKQALMTKVSKSSTATGRPFADIDVVGPIDTGGRKTKTVSAGTAVVWDSLLRDIFEKLGLLETKGFDVKLSCGVDYTLVTYEHLSQSFITGLTPKAVLIYNTPAARAMGMTVKAESNVKLGKTDKAPSGSVRFDFTLTSPVNKEAGHITIDIAGGKAKAKATL